MSYKFSVKSGGEYFYKWFFFIVSVVPPHGPLIVLVILLIFTNQSYRETTGLTALTKILYGHYFTHFQKVEG